jgi:cobalt-zinc-cadmium efflux system outer membrane protein
MVFRFGICVVVGAALAGGQTLSSMVDEALRRNPEILAAQKKYEAMRQRPSQASALPDPMLSLGYQAVGPPLPGAGLGSTAMANLGVTVSQEFPSPGKRGLRGEIAGKEAEEAFADYLAARLNVTARLERAYHELHHATVAVEFVKRYQDLLQQILSISQARYQVGRGAQQDIFKAQTQAAVFETQLVRYRQQVESREIEINSLMNRPAGIHIDMSEDIPLGEMPPPLDALLARAKANAPVLARDRAAVQESELAANLARKDYYPDYTISGGYFNQGGMAPVWQAQVSFKLPAWFGRKQRAEVTEQEFSASEARHQYAATDLNLGARIRELYSEAEAAYKLAGLYQKSVTPESNLALESSLASYEAGKLDFVSVFTNFMSVVDYELAYHEQVMQFHITKVALEEATGVGIQ